MGNPGRVIETKFDRCLKGTVKLINGRKREFEVPLSQEETLDSISNIEEYVANYLGLDVLDIAERISYPCIIDNTQKENPYAVEMDDIDKYFDKLTLRQN